MERDNTDKSTRWLHKGSGRKRVPRNHAHIYAPVHKVLTDINQDAEVFVSECRASVFHSLS